MCYFKLWWVVESPKSGLANVWHAALTPASFFNFFCPIRVAVLWVMCVCVYTRVYTHTHAYLGRYCLYITFGTKQYCEWNSFTQIQSGTKCWLVNYYRDAGMRWLGEYVTLDRTFYSLLFKQEVAVAARVTSRLSSLSHSFIRNMIS
jgi:hypothetical protein